jgi:hypothetical protein
MATTEELRAICLDDKGDPKDKDECRAALINHLILDEMLDVDDAEDKTEKTLDELGLWPQEETVENNEPPVV